MIGNCAFFGYLITFLALTMRIPLFKRAGRTDGRTDTLTDTQKNELIFRYRERSERRPSMIGNCAFFGYLITFLALTMRIPLFKRAGRTDGRTDTLTDTQKNELIFRYREK